MDNGIITIGPKQRDEIRKKKLIEERYTEDALGIGLNSQRHLHLIWLLDEVLSCNPTKAMAIATIGELKDINDYERAYLGFMLYQRILVAKVPFGVHIARRI